MNFKYLIIAWLLLPFVTIQPIFAEHLYTESVTTADTIEVDDKLIVTENVEIPEEVESSDKAELHS